MEDQNKAFMNNGWFLLDDDTPSFVKENIPLASRLGEHIMRTTTLENGTILLVAYDPSKHSAWAWMILPHPENVL